MTDLVRQTMVLRDIIIERDNQDKKWGANRNLEDQLWLTILIEEVGEVAMAMLDKDGTTRDELIQVGAVVVAWLECIDRQRDWDGL